MLIMVRYVIADNLLAVQARFDLTINIIFMLNVAEILIKLQRLA